MQYLLLIHSDQKKWDELPPEEVQQVLQRYGETYQAMQEAGVIVSAQRLHSPDSATTLRVRNGDLMTTDGPFAELKEQLGGFFLIEAPDLDEAIRWAARIPGAEYGAIEVRPIFSEGDQECGE
jgi:hypothetical protein